MKIVEIESKLTRGKGVLYYNPKKRFFEAKIHGRIVNQWGMGHMIDLLRKILGRTLSEVSPMVDKHGRVTNLNIIFADAKHIANQ